MFIQSSSQKADGKPAYPALPLPTFLLLINWLFFLDCALYEITYYCHVHLPCAQLYVKCFTFVISFSLWSLEHNSPALLKLLSSSLVGALTVQIALL